MRQPPDSIATITAPTLRQWLSDGDEIALLDVREAGEFGEGHPFFAIPLPYSRLELDLHRLVPRGDTRIVVLDGGDGIAERAALRLLALGYTQVHCLAGGAPAWTQAGYTLFQGVNLPSKTFGELVEHACGTPHMSAADLQARQSAGEALVLLDGRSFEEHQRMTLPGAVSVPNGELALHWRALAPDARTPIVVHCAGRTRSIIGAQILRSLGVPNPVFALENGTQGWALAGLPLTRGSTRRACAPQSVHADDRAAAARVAARAGVPLLTPQQAQAWLDDERRTTYVFDIRSAEEFAAASLAGARHAAGGQLLQASDQYIGVRGGRVLLLDDEAVRAPVVAAWLRRLGYESAVVQGGIHAALRPPITTAFTLPELPELLPAQLREWVAQNTPLLLDLQPSLAFRRQHASGARWALRPRLQRVAPAPGPGARSLLLLAADAALAQLAAIDLREAGWREVCWASLESWVAAGLPTQSTPDLPTDAEAIDYLFFVHDRHEGNLDAARRYLAWETGLIAQCAPDELSVFTPDERQAANIHI